MKYIFTYSLILFLASSLFAQSLNIPTNQRLPKSNFSLGIELGGAVISPMKSVFSKKGNGKFRPQFMVLYRAAHNLYFDVSVEYDQINQQTVYNNFNDYKMTGYAFKQSVVIQPGGKSWFFGFGFMQSSQKESGLLVIKGDYFGDYVRPASHMVTAFSTVLKTGFDYNVSPSVLFKLEGALVFSDLLVSNQQGLENQVVNYLAGSSLINSKYGEFGFGARVFAYLVYDF